MVACTKSHPSAEWTSIFMWTNQNNNNSNKNNNKTNEKGSYNFGFFLSGKVLSMKREFHFFITLYSLSIIFKTFMFLGEKLNAGYTYLLVAVVSFVSSIWANVGMTMKTSNFSFRATWRPSSTASSVPATPTIWPPPALTAPSKCGTSWPCRPWVLSTCLCSGLCGQKSCGVCCYNCVFWN